MPTDVALEWCPIWSTVCDLHWVWKFHSDLFGNPAHVALMLDILPGPLAIIRRGALLSVTMGIGRLLDGPEFGPRANLSFARLLKTIESRCPHEQVNVRLATMLDNTKVHCQPFTTWRNRRFGHADREMVLCNGGERFPDVEQAAFETALAMLRDLLSEIHGHFNGPGAIMPFPERIGDADALMGYIRAGHDVRQAEVASQLP